MKKGKVKFFNKLKGFGFIVDDETAKEIFVHSSGLVDQIQDGDAVTYEIGEGKKGPMAVNVQLAQ